MLKLAAIVLIFMVGMFFLATAILSGGSILRLLFRGPFGRVILRPLYLVTLRPIGWVLLGIARIGRRSAAPLGQGAQDSRGATPYSAMAQTISLQSIAELALGQVPLSIKNMLVRGGWPFRTVDANAAAVSLPATLTLDDARRNLESAHHYYKDPMGKNISPVLLYEDSEEALIIRILKDVDLAFFYAMRRINRNIRRNITKIIAIETIFVSSFPFLFSVAQAFAPAEKTLRMAVLGGTIGFYALLLWLVRMLLYGNATRINAQSFNYFMQTYFDRLLNQYKSADQQFESMPNDRTSDLHDVQQAASIWFINLHWLAARQWFLDLYARNMIFQIVRNRWLSWLTVPFYFALSLAVFWGLTLIPGMTALKHLPWELSYDAWLIYGPFVILLVIYWWTITGLLTEFWASVSPTNWSGFVAMDVDGMIERHIGRNVLEIVDKRRTPYGTQVATPYVPPTTKR